MAGPLAAGVPRVAPIRVEVGLGARSYPIVIGENLLRGPEAAELLAAHVKASNLLIVTNEVVAPLYLQTLQTALVGTAARSGDSVETSAPRKTGKKVATLILPDGEEHKTLEVVSRIFDAAVEARLNRDAAIVALGGGVVGDMAGFAAAAYQRGVDYIQIPTTLLAQVDSSVGGKTGVNHPGGKNLIGAFHQPRCVIADTSTLRTLSDREYRAGLAEIVKYGLIRDAEFFQWLESRTAALAARDPAAVAHAVRRSCEIKAEVVGIDEHEHGLRAILNLGHTFGHAVETATGYGTWLHGEAIAVGMLLACDLSVRQGWLPATVHERARTLMTDLGLPTVAPRIGATRALELMGMDKKVLAGKLRLVLLSALGTAVISSDYSPALLDAVLKEAFG